MTGNNCLLDTSIIVHSFKDSLIADRFDGFAEIFISTIAMGELYYGAYHSANVKRHLAQIKLFFQNCTVITPTVETADLYGQIKASLRSKGKPIPENDIWIAAMALNYNLPLLAF